MTDEELERWSRACEAVRELIRFIGDDPEQEDLLDTPMRFLSAWRQEWGAGYQMTEPAMRLFKTDTHHEMVIQRDIHYHSHCEHHLCPFYGTVDIAYIPQSGIVGLSKLARAVQFFARRLQTQERLTSQIADFLFEKVSMDVAVRIKGLHMCMTTRGVNQHEALTTTTALRGNFFASPTVRAEFYSTLSNGK